ncbi:winged helix-turn-helix domain-containing protein [Pseudomonas sp. C9-3]|uniref:winged helix-turn-helix domain-containing protein n=1 Tax=Pseudomonas sp. C9-3 TaxID=3078264 RepID=UPI0028ED6F49|nr:winged helix-turn-helix domain-containing protein [Pseudomonas sp. C9-3]
MINDLIVFDDEGFKLFPVAGGEEVQLNAISSRCLAQLVEAGGEVVLSNDLIGGAWECFGLEVTESSLAQSIRQLRLSMDRLHPGYEYIQILPKIGYRLSKEVVITVYSSLPAIDQRHSGYRATEDVGFFPDKAAIWREKSSFTKLGVVFILFAWCFGMFWVGSCLRGLQKEGFTMDFGPPQRIHGISVYISNSVAVTKEGLDKALQAVSRSLEVLNVSRENASLYIAPGDEGHQSIVCDGDLSGGYTRCVGLNLND